MSDQEELNQPTPEPGLFDDYIDHPKVEATTGQRFVNYLIDNFLMNIALSLLTEAVLRALLVRLYPDEIPELIIGQSTLSYLLWEYGIGMFNYLLYYVICEKAFKGYTVGKLVSGTRAIRLDGGELTFKDALMRTLVRFIPFEPFSALGGKPWHDTWTKTIVIKAR